MSESRNSKVFFTVDISVARQAVSYKFPVNHCICTLYVSICFFEVDIKNFVIYCLSKCESHCSSACSDKSARQIKFLHMIQCKIYSS